MIGDITELTLEQFSHILRNAWRRRVTSVHVHHTWKPRTWQWTGRRSVEAIRRYHTEHNGWSDIAQHLTIGPDGSLWTGRHLDRPPASASSHNGDRHAGPLMIELIGDFDVAQDQFLEPQAGSTYRAIAQICERFGLTTANIRFHREFNAGKSCPGTSFSLSDFRGLVQAELAAIARARGDAPRVIEGIVPPVPAGVDIEADIEAEPAECGIHARGELYGEDSPPFTEQELSHFADHVINTEMGKLSDSGHFASTVASLKALIDSVERWAADTESPRVVLFAHGGLVSEVTALRNIVTRDRQWWLKNGVYPIFFVWETGLFDVLLSQAAPDTDALSEGERGLKEWLLEKTDGLLENALGKTLGRASWERMKASAFLLSRRKADAAEPGGGYLFADLFSEWLARRKATGQPAVEVHAVAHSAGAIVMCHLLPRLNSFLKDKDVREGGQTTTTLSFLAPACRSDLFESKLVPLIRNGRIGSFAQFTMNESAERDDRVTRLYGLSLLYMVRNACERGRPGILGLEESIRSNRTLSKLFGLTARTSGDAELILSPTGSVKTGRSASHAITHGGFDDDAGTMNSVLLRILNLPDDATLPCPRIPGVSFAANRQLDTIRRDPETGHEAHVHALCIGIDDYVDSPLYGCVADAKRWAEVLASRGVTVQSVLLNSQATKSAIVDAWTDICERANHGDTVVIQFAGHGTQVPDLSGDESDYYDEAWVTYDYSSGEVLLDDEIGGLIDRYRAKSLQIVLFTDCCHSGTGTRARSGAITETRESRFLRLDNNANFVRAFRRSARLWAQRLPGRQTDVLGPEVHFAGCQDDQSSYESNGQGDFTRAATDALQQMREAHSYRDLADQIRTAFSGNGRQKPNFRARKHRAKLPVFGDASSVQPTSGSVQDESQSGGIIDRVTELERQVRILTREIDSLD